MFIENMMGKGINKAISISNTRKITANRKNRVEKGIRAEFLGSNPHSKGDLFSRSFIDRMFKINPNNKITNEINKLNPKLHETNTIHKK